MIESFEKKEDDKVHHFDELVVGVDTVVRSPMTSNSLTKLEGKRTRSAATRPRDRVQVVRV